MRILVLTQYFPPETGAAQNRLFDWVRRLDIAGHEMTVLTSMPSYPAGRVFDGYRGRFVMSEKIGAISVVRTWSYVSTRLTFAKRLLNYGSFVVTSALFGLLRIPKRVDVVLFESPPLFLGLSAVFLSSALSAKLVMNVSDLWPESAVAVGAVKNKFLIRLASGLEDLLYRRVDLITGQTRGIIQTIRSRTGKDCLFLPNGVNSMWPDSQRKTSIENDRVLSRDAGRVVVGYAGLHGLAQDLDTIIAAADVLRDDPRIRFVFVGDGPEKCRIQQSCVRKGLKNVAFYPSCHISRMPEILAGFDIAVVSLQKHALFKGALPSKLFEAMGAGLPIIVCIDGEARSMVEAASGGIFVEPGNPMAMANAITKLAHDPALRAQFGENAKNYVCTHYNRADIADRLESGLSQLFRVVPDDRALSTLDK